jgi:cytoskeletal protein CcmA (bactofilin family)
MIPKMGDKSIKAYMSNETVFKGTLSFVGTVRIDGKFEGKVVTDDTLIIGEMGEIKADVEVGSFICMGKVEGTVRAKEKVHLMASSRVSGNFVTPSLTIEQGALLDGNCNMSGGVESNKVIPMNTIENTANEEATG